MYMNELAFAPAGDRAVTVLGDQRAARRSEHSRGRREVDRVGAVTARADNVQRRALRLPHRIRIASPNDITDSTHRQRHSFTQLHTSQNKQASIQQS